jgi:DNA-binding MarR family transcriptional regulator
MRSPQELEAAAHSRLRPLAPTLDLESFQAVWLLHEAAAAARRHLETEALGRHDLTWTQFEVLWHLWLFETEQHRGIAASVGISKGSVTAITTALEERRLLHRVADPADRRRISFTLSRSGKSLMRKLFPEFNRAEASFAGGLSAGDKAELTRLLRQLVGDPSTRRAP